MQTPRQTRKLEQGWNAPGLVPQGLLMLGLRLGEQDVIRNLWVESMAALEGTARKERTSYFLEEVGGWKLLLTLFLSKLFWGQGGKGSPGHQRQRAVMSFLPGWRVGQRRRDGSLRHKADTPTPCTLFFEHWNDVQQARITCLGLHGKGRLGAKPSGCFPPFHLVSLSR